MLGIFQLKGFSPCIRELSALPRPQEFISSCRLRKTASSECKASSISVSLDTLEVASSADAEQDNGSFEHMVEQSSTPILVDFYAPWCGPCQLMSKIVAVRFQASQGLLQMDLLCSAKYEAERQGVYMVHQDGGAEQLSLSLEELENYSVMLCITIAEL